MKSYAEYKRNEKITKFISKISMIAVIIAIIGVFLNLFINEPFIDTISLTGIVVFMLPMILLQIAMPANWHNFGTNSMGNWSYLFYIIIFPLSDIWVINGLNGLFHFLSNYQSENNQLFRMVARAEYFNLILLYSAILYVFLITIGLLLRFFKKKS